MKQWGFEKQVPVSSLFAGWAPSRAVNPSDGLDPISLGLFSGKLAPVDESLPSSLIPSPEAPSAPEAVTFAAAPPHVALPPPQPEVMRNMVMLDDGRVHLNGRFFNLSLEAKQKVMAAVVDAYAQTLQDEVDSLRMEYDLYPQTGQEEQTMREANREAPVVQQLPGEGTSPEQEAARREAAKNLQQMFLDEAARRGLPVVSGRPPRKRTPTPDARHVLPRVPTEPTP